MQFLETPCKQKTTLLEELFSTKTKKWDFRISKVHFFPFVFLFLDLILLLYAYPFPLAYYND